MTVITANPSSTSVRSCMIPDTLQGYTVLARQLVQCKSNTIGKGCQHTLTGQTHLLRAPGLRLSHRCHHANDKSDGFSILAIIEQRHICCAGPPPASPGGSPNSAGRPPSNCSAATEHAHSRVHSPAAGVRQSWGGDAVNWQRTEQKVLSRTAGIKGGHSWGSPDAGSTVSAAACRYRVPGLDCCCKFDLNPYPTS